MDDVGIGRLLDGRLLTSRRQSDSETFEGIAGHCLCWRLANVSCCVICNGLELRFFLCSHLNEFFRFNSIIITDDDANRSIIRIKSFNQFSIEQNSPNFKYVSPHRENSPAAHSQVPTYRFQCKSSRLTNSL